MKIKLLVSLLILMGYYLLIYKGPSKEQMGKYIEVNGKEKTFVDAVNKKGPSYYCVMPKYEDIKDFLPSEVIEIKLKK